jgi:hypothetical protein
MQRCRDAEMQRHRRVWGRLPSGSSCRHSKVISNCRGFVNAVGLSKTFTLMMFTSAIVEGCVLFAVRKVVCMYGMVSQINTQNSNLLFA